VPGIGRGSAHAVARRRGGPRVAAPGKLDAERLHVAVVPKTDRRQAPLDPAARPQTAGRQGRPSYGPAEGANQFAPAASNASGSASAPAAAPPAGEISTLCRRGDLARMRVAGVGARPRARPDRAGRRNADRAARRRGRWRW